MAGRRRDAPDDLGMRGSSVSSVLKEARASLHNPSRPMTPADPSRRLFGSSEYASRPSSAYSLPSSGSFFGDLPASPSDSEVPRTPPLGLARVPPMDPAALSLPEATHQEHKEPREHKERRGSGKKARPPLSRSSSSSSSLPQGAPSPAATPTRPAKPKPPASGSPAGRPSPSPPSPTAAAAPSTATNGADDEAELERHYETWKSIRTLLERLDPDKQDGDALYHGICDLHTLVLADGFLARLRSVEQVRILKALTPLLDQPSPKLLIRLSAIILLVASDGKGIHSSCRLLFKLSKTDGNDRFFRGDKVIEPLLNVLESSTEERLTQTGLSAADAFDTQLFGVATLKNATNEEGNQKFVAQQGGVRIMTELLRRHGARESTEKQAQLLVQITGVLRNLAVLQIHRKQFVVFETVQALCDLFARHSKHKELMMNVARIISKLSLAVDCRAAIASQSAYIAGMLDTMQEHSADLPIVVRLCFTMGNMTAVSDDLRLVIGAEHDGVTKLLLLLRQYLTRFVKGKAPEAKTKASVLKDLEDALVKIIRLLANLSINVSLGRQLAETKGVDAVCELLRTEAGEELVLNTVALVTNLAFYRSPVLWARRLELCAALQPLLLHPNPEAVVEAARAYGSFSVEDDVRQLMASSKIDQMAVILLDHREREVVFSTCGMLMNMAGREEHHAIIMDTAGLQKLIDVIDRFGIDDAAVSIAACKTLYNLCSSCGGIPADEALQLKELLLDLDAAVRKRCDGASIKPKQLRALTELREVAARLGSKVDEVEHIEEGDQYECDLEPLEWDGRGGDDETE